MISLLKNHQHYSKIYFIEEVDRSNNKKHFIKSSSSLDGITDISTELKGIIWYNSKVNNKINYEICIQKENYIKVKYLEIQGVVPILTKKTYRSNIRYIEIVIDHYCAVWGGDEEKVKVPLHGDFSLLGNIIFMNDEIPVVIDWEHFKLNSAPIGFDAMYFLFELLWFEMSQANDICEKSLSHLKRMLLKLKSANCLNEIFLNRPLEATKEFMLNNNSYWGSQFDKMPIIFFRKEEIYFIDKEININIEI